MLCHALQLVWQAVWTFVILCNLASVIKGLLGRFGRVQIVAARLVTGARKCYLIPSGVAMASQAPRPPLAEGALTSWPEAHTSSLRGAPKIVATPLLIPLVLHFLAASGVFKGPKNQFSTKEKIGKHGLISSIHLFETFFQAFT